MINIDATTPQLKLAMDVTEAYLSRNLTSVAPYLSKNFTYQTFPKIADLPEVTKGGHVETYGAVLASFTQADIDIHELIDAPGKLVAHATVTYVTAEGTTLDYDTVCIVSFVEEDGGLKVLGIKDFADPQKRGAFHATAAKALAKGVA